MRETHKILKRPSNPAVGVRSIVDPRRLVLIKDSEGWLDLGGDPVAVSCLGASEARRRVCSIVLDGKVGDA